MIETYRADDMADKAQDTSKFGHDNPLPYGGITDIHGNILRAISKEEHDEMLAKVRRAFRSKSKGNR